MATIQTKWESTKPNPDEKHIKTLWQDEIKNLENSIAKESQASKRQETNRMNLVKAAKFSKLDMDKLIRAEDSISRKSLIEAEKRIVKPPINFDVLHKQDLDLAKANAKNIGKGNPSWQGYIWNPTYGGWWSSWDGEAEEIPNTTINSGANRIDPRAQAWGEGWFDSDYSEIHAYLAFTFRPPSWGHLHIHATPWLHGYYSLYSNDDWYNSVYARAEVDTWVDAHQNYWRSRQSQRRFTLSGYELHPERSGRIDSQYGQIFYTNVGATDTVTIRVGVRLYCRAKASGGRSRLNFQAGAANYVYIPYVYWYLHQ